jgi:hypothetical protein
MERWLGVGIDLLRRSFRLFLVTWTLPVLSERALRLLPTTAFFIEARRFD